MPAGCYVENWMVIAEERECPAVYNLLIRLKMEGQKLSCFGSKIFYGEMLIRLLFF